MTVAKKIVQSGGSLKLYKSYSFRDKDPIIDEVRTLIKDESASYADIHRASGVSETTLYQWFAGTTKRPQFATIMAVTRALGYDLKITKLDAADAKPSKRTATIHVLHPRRRAVA